MARNVFKQPTIARSLLGAGNYVLDPTARLSAIGNYHLQPGIREFVSHQKQINDQMKAIVGPTRGLLATQRAQMEALEQRGGLVASCRQTRP